MTHIIKKGNDSLKLPLHIKLCITMQFLELASNITSIRIIVMVLKLQGICSSCKEIGTKLKEFSFVYIIIQTYIIRQQTMKCGVNMSTVVCRQ
jgi:hypothetical protein